MRCSRERPSRETGEMGIGVKTGRRGPSSVSFADTFSRFRGRRNFGGGGLGFGEMGLNGFEDFGRVLEDLVVLESDDFQALGFEPSGSLKILGLVFWQVVNGSVEFDHQAFFKAIIIGSVTSNHCLSSEFSSRKPPVTKQHPQRRLRRSHLLSSLLSQPNQPSSHPQTLASNPSQLSRKSPHALLPRERGEGVSFADG
jgi:hypothetical protein